MAKSSKVYAHTKSSHRGCLVIFGGVFLLAGVGIIVGTTIIPLNRVLGASDWVETPCTIISSTLEIESSDDGSTYWPNIYYSYAFGEGDYESGRYNFAAGSTGNRDRHQAVVDRYPPGSTTICYVNPNSPEEAVLSRGVSREYFYGFLGLPFALVGLVIVVVALSSTGTAKRKDVPNEPGAKLKSADRGPVTVNAGHGPIARLIGITFITVFWNGITWAIVYGISSDGSHLRLIVPYLFLTPFVLIGLGLVAACLYCLLAIFNPRVRLTMNPGSARLGEEVNLEWIFSGATHRIRQLSISLEGVEQARYTRGTSTYTDKHTFAAITISETTIQRDIRIGRVQFTVPEYTMHSFDGGNNKILWSIKIAGTIDNWPDVAESFDFEILPLAIGERQ